MSKQAKEIDIVRDADRILRAMNRAIRAAIGAKPKRKPTKTRKTRKAVGRRRRAA